MIYRPPGKGSTSSWPGPKPTPSSVTSFSPTSRRHSRRRGSNPSGASSKRSAAVSRRNRLRAAPPSPYDQQVAQHEPTPEPAESLPAWSLTAGAAERIPIGVDWPERVTREWAWGGSTGKGVRVCILDSGVEVGHPLGGELDRSVAVAKGEGDEVDVEEDTKGDLCGHGTACAGIDRSLAPECSLISVRVLGAGFTGSGPVLLGGLRWAVDQGFDVINMSLSTTKRQFATVLHELADRAYFNKSVLVASAHNMPVESYPWRFSSVVSVGSHEEEDPL